MTNTRTVIAAGVAVAVMALAGCMGQNQKDSAPSTGPPPVATINVRETEMKIDPENPKIDKPGVVEFKVDNAGKTVHALEVEGPKGEVETKQLQAGQSATLRADLNKPGKYKWYCPVPGHEEAGMRGTITVGSG
jgi:uncharacterized cupredoxin-like copper-binding protein